MNRFFPCFLISLLSLLLAACSTEQSTDKPNTSAANEDTEKNVADKESEKTPSDATNSQASKALRLTKEGIVFNGKEVSQIRDLATSLRNTSNRAAKKADGSNTILVSVEDKTTNFGRLQKVIHELQKLGSSNLQIQSDEYSVTVPYPAATNDSSMKLMTVSISSESNGEFCGCKIDLDGQTSWVESGEIDQAITSAQSRIEKAISGSASGNQSSSQKLEIELIAKPGFSAAQFVEFCGKLRTYIKSQDDKSPKITLWPMGFPREDEQPIELKGPINFSPGN